MKITFRLLIFFLLPLQTFATGQNGDILIWKGDTSTAFSNPLERRNDIKHIRQKFFGENTPFNTGCWRGYVAEWTIIDDELYLTKIYTCDYPDQRTADLKNIFGREYVDGRVKASWYTGEILLPKGKQLIYDHSAYFAYYEREILLVFNEGKLRSEHNYSYPKTHESIYSRHRDSLFKFIYSNVNWNIIPPLGDQKIRVTILGISGDTDKPDSIRVLGAVSEEIFSKEAVRVASLLPDWNVYYTRGKVLKRSFSFAVIFDEEKRKKFAP